MRKKPVFDTSLVKAFMEDANLGAMDLVRLCGISVSSAYDIRRGKPVSDLGVLYKVYTGLRAAGYQITWQDITGIY